MSYEQLSKKFIKLYKKVYGEKLKDTKAWTTEDLLVDIEFLEDELYMREGKDG